MTRLTLLVAFIAFSNSCAQIKSPIETNNYSRYTFSREVENFLLSLSSFKKEIKIELIAKDSKNENIYAAFLSSDTFKTSKPWILIFAQQHGNENSGKEAALLLIARLLEHKEKRPLRKCNLIVIPQLNPTGSDMDQRRNSDGVDLNRDHLILSTKETQALRKLYLKYQPIAALDVHEFYPYSEAWEKFGLYKAADVLFGTLTNPNIEQDIIKLQREDFLPKVIEALRVKNYYAGEYIVGGPPDKERMRRSSLDINDGRQSFGVMGCFSMILEGKNGKTSNDSLFRRTHSQYEAIMFFLNYVNENFDKIYKLVSKARFKNIFDISGRYIPVRYEREYDRDSTLVLLSDKEGNLKEVFIHNFHSKISSKYYAKAPKGYLVPKADEILLQFLKNSSIVFYDANIFNFIEAEKFIIENTYMEHLEELQITTPNIRVEKTIVSALDNFFYVPVSQVQSISIILAFEPMSMYGLCQYPRYSYLLKEGYYPILRAIDYLFEEVK